MGNTRQSYNSSAITSDMIAEMVRTALLSNIVEAKNIVPAEQHAAPATEARVAKSIALSLLLTSLWLCGRMIGLN